MSGSRMTITLTPDIEQILSEQAQQQGLSPERLALQILKERLAVAFNKRLSPNIVEPKRVNKKNLMTFLAGRIGVLDSSEYIKGGAQMSEKTGQKFAAILLEKHRRGKQ